MNQSIGLPISFSFTPATTVVMQDKNIEESIDDILELIVFTPKGSFSADPDFGFEYWNHEFSNVNVREFNNNYIGLMSNEKSLNDFSRKQCELSLRESILNYEPRLHNPEVKVELELNTRTRKRNLSSKYEMRVIIDGSIDDGLGVIKPYEKRISFMVEPIAHKTSY